MLYLTSSFPHLATSTLLTYISNRAPTALCAELLLPNCVHFCCCSPIASTRHMLLAACVCFSCCSPFASASAAARCLRPLQLLLPGIGCVRFICSRLRLLQLLLPDCICFNSCSPIAQLLLPDCVRFNYCSPIEVQRSRIPYSGKFWWALNLVISAKTLYF